MQWNEWFRAPQQLLAAVFVFDIFWPSQIDSIDIPLTMRRQVFSGSGTCLCLLWSASPLTSGFFPTRWRTKNGTSQGHSNKRLEGLKILKSLLWHVISINQWLIIIYRSYLQRSSYKSRFCQDICDILETRVYNMLQSESTCETSVCGDELFKLF